MCFILNILCAGRPLQDGWTYCAARVDSVWNRLQLASQMTSVEVGVQDA
jgi:hypothetical protein